jgi:hypothetical protein
MRVPALLLAALCAATLYADQKPVVKTAFIIQSAKFANGLGATAKAEAERDIARQIAALGNERFPFFDWQPAVGRGTQYIVTLRQEDLDAVRSSFHLDYEAVVGGTKGPVSLGAKRDFYSVTNRTKPFRDRITLADDVMKRLGADLENFDTGFQEQFVSKIALCTQHRPRIDANHMIVVPIPWAQLKTAPTSELFAKVFVHVMDGELRTPAFIADGRLHLTNLEPAGDSLVGGYLGEVRAAMVDTKVWQEEIVSALDVRRIERFTLFVRTYRRDTTGGLAEEP